MRQRAHCTRAPRPAWIPRWAAWIGLTLAIAGCTTVGPDFVQPKAPVLEQWQEADAAVVTHTPARAGPLVGRLSATRCSAS